MERVVQITKLVTIIVGVIAVFGTVIFFMVRDEFEGPHDDGTANRD